MSTMPTRLPDTPMEELVELSNSMKDAIRAANEEARQEALDRLSQRTGLIRRLLPTQYEREGQRIAVERLRQLSNSKGELIQLYTAAQLAIARKKADALVAAQGMHLQTQLARFADEKIRDLSETLNASRTEFMASMRPQFDNLKDYEDIPELYEPARRSVNHHITTYFGSIEKLLDGFSASIGNRVSQIQQSGA